MKLNVLLILLVGLVFISGCVGQSGPQTSDPEPAATLTPPPTATSSLEPVATFTPTETPVPDPTATSTPTAAPETQITGEVKEFEITARRFAYSPSMITVNKGDTVKLRITSADVTHGFTIDKLGVSKTLRPGETVEVEFIADQVGTLSFYCTVYCGEGHSGMKGWLFLE